MSNFVAFWLLFSNVHTIHQGIAGNINSSEEIHNKYEIQRMAEIFETGL